MSAIYIPTNSIEDWKQFLAEPEKQWKAGYSAMELARCWESSSGFPTSFKKIFRNTSEKALQKQELIFGIPEFKVSLPGGSRASQNDLFVLSKTSDGELASIMVEGKVSESFGPTVGKWLIDASDGKKKRLSFMKGKLGFKNELSSSIRYQLLHRTVSAILTAEKLNAKYTIMIVHSFSKEKMGLSDFQEFVKLFGSTYYENQLINVLDNNIKLYLGWVSEN